MPLAISLGIDQIPPQMNRMHSLVDSRHVYAGARHDTRSNSEEPTVRHSHVTIAGAGARHVSITTAVPGLMHNHVGIRVQGMMQASKQQFMQIAK